MDQDAQDSVTHKLIDAGILTHNQLTKALEYQCRLPPGQFMPLLKVLLEFEFVTEAQLEATLGDDYHQQDPIGKLLIEQGIVSGSQLEQALQILNTFSRSHVTDILIDLGFVTRGDIERAISKHQIEVSQGLNQPTQSLIPTTAHKTSHDISSGSDEPAAAGEGSGLAAEPAAAKADSVEQAAVHLPLGRQLIAKGYLNEQELRDAIEYQRRLPKVMHRPLGEILVMLGYINEAQLKESLAAQPPAGRSRIGEILIQAELIEDWQLAHALSLQFSPEHAHKKLGMLLVELGYARRDEIEGVLAKHYRDQPEPAGAPLRAPSQMQALARAHAPTPPPTEIQPAPSVAGHKPLGQILIDRGYITPAQLQEGLSSQTGQSADYMPLGDILVLKGYLSESQLQECLRDQPGFAREPLGQILIRQGLLQEWQLAHALCIQNAMPAEERKNLGALLVAQGYCTQDAIEAAVLRDLRQKHA